MSKRSYERRVRAKREAQRAARKRAERMRKFRVWSSAAAAVAIAVVLLIVFLGGNDEKEPSAQPTTSTSATPIAGCTMPAPEPTPNGKTFTKAPPMTINRDKIYVATLQTSCGNIVMRMDPQQSPATVNSFVFLARQAFYDNTKFGRVQNDPNFGLVQAGTQTGTISGGVDYTYQGETPPPGTKYSRGVVAMANSQGPSTNGSQFFIVVTSADFLDQNPNYSILGKVQDAASLATLDRVIRAKGPPVQPGQSLGVSPNPPIFILKVAIAEQNR
jgi:peptidyl-prolyl cis-trans isomerase B (cyclophilin B)